MANDKRAQPAPQQPTAPPSGEAAPAAPPRRTRPDWRWRSFPVFAAFAAGMLLAFIVNEGSVTPVAFVLQIAALLGVGYSLAHLFVTNIIATRRTRRDHPDDDTEDVVVYPDEK